MINAPVSGEMSNHCRAATSQAKVILAMEGKGREIRELLKT
jgi:hypothetical protein